MTNNISWDSQVGRALTILSVTEAQRDALFTSGTGNVGTLVAVSDGANPGMHRWAGNAWTPVDAPRVQELTDTANIKWNVSTGEMAWVDVKGNRQLTLMTQQQRGIQYSIIITADHLNRVITFAPEYLDDKGAPIGAQVVPANSSRAWTFASATTTPEKADVQEISTTLADPTLVTQVLPEAATVSWNTSIGRRATLSLTGVGAELQLPTNIVSGGLYYLDVTAVGADRVLTFAAGGGLTGGEYGDDLAAHTILADTTETFVFLSPDGSVLQRINDYTPDVVSNLSLDNRTSTSLDILVDTGTGVTLDSATPTSGTNEAGLMSAADKTHLDAIEPNATADQTAAEILTEIKTVDGAGSGLDADLLDGQEGSFYTGLSATNANDISDLQDDAIVQDMAIALNTAKRTYPLADETKLSGVETGATADQTDAEIKTAYENNADTNAFDDAAVAKLAESASTSYVDLAVTSSVQYRGSYDPVTDTPALGNLGHGDTLHGAAGSASLLKPTVFPAIPTVLDSVWTSSVYVRKEVSATTEVQLYPQLWDATAVIESFQVYVDTYTGVVRTVVSVLTAGGSPYDSSDVTVTSVDADWWLVTAQIVDYGAAATKARTLYYPHETGGTTVAARSVTLWNARIYGSDGENIQLASNDLAGADWTPLTSATVTADTEVPPPVLVDADTLIAPAGTGANLQGGNDNILALTSAGAEWVFQMYVKKTAGVQFLRPLVRLRDAVATTTEQFGVRVNTQDGTVATLDDVVGGPPYTLSDTTVTSFDADWWVVTCTLVDTVGDGKYARVVLYQYDLNGSNVLERTAVVWGVTIADPVTGRNIRVNPNDYAGTGWNLGSSLVVTPDTELAPTHVEIYETTGAMYTVTADGVFFGENVEIGDTLIAEVNNPHGIDDWTTVQRNTDADGILAAIKTVDGAGSGLDADLLDGQEGTFYTGLSAGNASDISDLQDADLVHDAAIALNTGKLANVPTGEHAASEAYVDSAVVGNLVYSGGYDPTTDTPELGNVEHGDTVHSTAGAGQYLRKNTFALTSSLDEVWRAGIYVLKDLSDIAEVRIRPTMRDSGFTPVEQFEAAVNTYTGVVRAVTLSTSNGGGYTTSDISVTSVDANWWYIECVLQDYGNVCTTGQQYFFPADVGGTDTLDHDLILWRASFVGSDGVDLLAAVGSDFSDGTWVKVNAGTVTVDTTVPPPILMDADTLHGAAGAFSYGSQGYNTVTGASVTDTWHRDFYVRKTAAVAYVAPYMFAKDGPAGSGTMVQQYQCRVNTNTGVVSNITGVIGFAYTTADVTVTSFDADWWHVDAKMYDTGGVIQTLRTDYYPLDSSGSATTERTVVLSAVKLTRDSEAVTYALYPNNLELWAFGASGFATPNTHLAPTHTEVYESTGSFYTITAPGLFFGETVEVGDSLIAEVNNPFGVDDWTVVQANLDAEGIKAAYESNADTNAFTDAEQAALAAAASTAYVDAAVASNITHKGGYNTTTDTPTLQGFPTGDSITVVAGSGSAINSRLAVTSVLNDVFEISFLVKKTVGVQYVRAYATAEDVVFADIEQHNARINTFDGAISNFQSNVGGPYTTADITVAAFDATWWLVTQRVTDTTGDVDYIRSTFYQYDSAGVIVDERTAVIVDYAVFKNASNVNLFPSPNDLTTVEWTHGGDVTVTEDTTLTPSDVPAGIFLGDMYTVTTAGTFFTETVEVGDVLIADKDDPVNVDDWTTVQKNLDAPGILAALITVDGTGSGLDADLLDGQEGTFYTGLSSGNANDISDLQDDALIQDAAIALNTAKRTYPLADENKVAGIESGATADQTDAEIKTAYENNADTNEFSDAEQTKLAATVEDGKVKISSSDTTEGYLKNKIVSGMGLVQRTLNGSGNEDLEIEMGSHYLALGSTGLYEGAELSISATAGSFDVTAGEGHFVDATTDFDNIVVTPVTIAAATIAVDDIAIQAVSYILVDSSGTVNQQGSFPTPAERRTQIFLGVVVHSDNIIVNAINNLPSVAIDVAAQVQDIMAALGLMNLTGNVIFPNVAGNLTIDKSAGTIFKAGVNFHTDNKTPHVVAIPAAVILTFRYRNQDSSEGANTTLLDPTTYDVSGTTTAVGGSGNSSTIQRIFMFPSGLVRVQRGQEVFSSMSDAIAHVGKEVFVTEANIDENGLLLGSWVLKRTATDLTDSSEAEFFIASRFGELGSGGSSSVTTLQDAYNNSIDPEILTNATLGALSIRRGSAADSDIVFEVRSGVNSSTFTVDGTGNIISVGTVDGRDVATDGTKLDGIETGATADQTATEIINAVKTLDGIGSGLDADLLDGQHGSFYTGLSSNNANDISDLQDDAIVQDVAIALNTAKRTYPLVDENKLAGIEANAKDDMTPAEILAAIKTVDGSGSGLDADLLDGFTVYSGAVADSIARRDASGDLFAVNVHASGTVDGRDVATDGAKLDGIEAGATADMTASELLTAIKTVDGLGSGLDADKVGGTDSVDIVKFGGHVMNTYSHGSATLYNSQIDNGLFLASTRFTAVANLYLTVDDSFVSAVSASEVAQLFDGNYDQWVAVPVDHYMIVSLTFPDTSNTYFPGYPYGYAIVSPYSSNKFETLSSRVYSNYAPHTIGWHSFTYSDLRSDNPDKAQISNFQQKFNVSEMEWTIGSSASVEAWVAQIEYVMDRPGRNETPTFSKYEDQTLYKQTNWGTSPESADRKASITELGVALFQTLTVNGDITLTGTGLVDGRDVATDGAKLDGIETAATADQTAAEILAELITVDGASSGLDADLLDGQQGTFYTGLSSGNANDISDLQDDALIQDAAIALNTAKRTYPLVDENKVAGIEAGATADMTPAELLAAIKTVDGSGSGLDADLHDGYAQSSSVIADTLVRRSASADIYADEFDAVNGYKMGGESLIDYQYNLKGLVYNPRYTAGVRPNFHNYGPNLVYSAEERGYTAVWSDLTGVTNPSRIWHPDGADNYCTLDMATCADPLTISLEGSFPTTTSVNSIRIFLQWHTGGSYTDRTFEVKGSDDTWYPVPMEYDAGAGLLFSETLDTHAAYPALTPWKGIRVVLENKTTNTGSGYIYGIGLYGKRGSAYPFSVNKRGDTFYGQMTTRDLVPSTSDTYSLGTPSFRFKNLELSGGQLYNDGTTELAGTNTLSGPTIASGTFTTTNLAYLNGDTKFDSVKTDLDLASTLRGIYPFTSTFQAANIPSGNYAVGLEFAHTNTFGQQLAMGSGSYTTAPEMFIRSYNASVYTSWLEVFHEGNGNAFTDADQLTLAEAASEAYVDQAVTSSVQYRGGYDPTTDTPELGNLGHGDTVTFAAGNGAAKIENVNAAISSSAGAELGASFYMQKDAAPGQWIQVLTVFKAGNTSTEGFFAWIEADSGVVDSVSPSYGGPYTVNDVVVTSVDADWWHIRLIIRDTAGTITTGQMQLFGKETGGASVGERAMTFWGGAILGEDGVNVLTAPNDMTDASWTASVDTTVIPDTAVPPPIFMDADTLVGAAGSASFAVETGPTTPVLDQEWITTVYVKKEASSDNRVVIRATLRNVSAVEVERIEVYLNPFDGTLNTFSSSVGGPYTIADVTVTDFSATYYKVDVRLQDYGGTALDTRVYLFPWGIGAGVPAGVQSVIIGGVTVIGDTGANVLSNSRSLEQWGLFTGATVTPNTDLAPAHTEIYENTGAMYTITAAGLFFGELMEIGDTLIAETSNPHGIEDWTTVQKNLDAASIKSAYESNADTNAFTDADEAKLDAAASEAYVDAAVVSALTYRGGYDPTTDTPELGNLDHGDTVFGTSGTSGNIDTGTIAVTSALDHEWALGVYVAKEASAVTEIRLRVRLREGGDDREALSAFVDTYTGNVRTVSGTTTDVLGPGYTTSDVTVTSVDDNWWHISCALVDYGDNADGARIAVYPYLTGGSNGGDRNISVASAFIFGPDGTNEVPYPYDFSAWTLNIATVTVDTIVPPPILMDADTLTGAAGSASYASSGTAAVVSALDKPWDFGVYVRKEASAGTEIRWIAELRNTAGPTTEAFSAFVDTNTGVVRSVSGVTTDALGPGYTTADVTVTSVDADWWHISSRLIDYGWATNPAVKVQALAYAYETGGGTVASRSIVLWGATAADSGGVNNLANTNSVDQWNLGASATATPNTHLAPTHTAVYEDPGAMYTITAAGLFFGELMEVGDALIAETANPHGIDDWTTVQKNLDASGIKAAYESNDDTNAYTDVDQAKVAQALLADGTVAMAATLDAAENIISNVGTVHIGVSAPAHLEGKLWLDTGSTGAGNFVEEYVTHDLTSSTTLSEVHVVVFCTGTFTITLPTAVGIKGRVYTIINESTGLITIAPDGSELVMGEATTTAVPDASIRIISNGAGWRFF